MTGVFTSDEEANFIRRTIRGRVARNAILAISPTIQRIFFDLSIRKDPSLRVRSCTTIYQNIIRPFSILSTNTFKVRRHWKYTGTFPSALTTWHFRGFGTEPEIPALPIVARRNRKSLQLTEQRACYSLIDVRKKTDTRYDTTSFVFRDKRTGVAAVAPCARKSTQNPPEWLRRATRKISPESRRRGWTNRHGRNRFQNRFTGISLPADNL